MENNNVSNEIILGDKAKNLSTFWDFFCNLPGKSGDNWPSEMRKQIKDSTIPLWAEDLEVAIQIDGRFENHFARVIQLAIWAMGKDSSEGTHGPESIGKDCGKEILSLRNQVIAAFNEFLKNTIENEFSKLGDDKSPTFEISPEVIEHVVHIVALYHDIGKRIATTRHPDEGYFYLRNVIGNKEKERLSELICDIELPPIFKGNSDMLKKRIKSEIWDVFLTVIRYHDCPGVLSTGEASLGILVDAISYHTKSIEKQIFILLLLGFTNTIDASALIGGKSLGDDGGIYVEKIKNNIDDLTLFNYVLKKRASQTLGHLINSNNNEFEYIDKMKLEEEILRVEKAEYRTVGRIERLVKENAPEELKTKIDKDIIKEAIVGAVGRTNIQEFCRRMAAVVKLDYMLPFVGWLERYPEKIWDAIIKGKQFTKLPNRAKEWAAAEISVGSNEGKRNDEQIKKVRSMLSAILEHSIYSALRSLMGKIILNAIDETFLLWANNIHGLDKKNLKTNVESFFKTCVGDIKNIDLKKIPQDGEIYWIPKAYQIQKNEDRSDLNFIEITAILTCLGHYFNSKDAKIMDFNVKKEKDNVNKEYQDYIRESAETVSQWGRETGIIDSELKHLAVTFESHFNEYGPVIPVEKLVDLKQWFSDTNLVKHYLLFDPIFMATHIIALLWQLVQKYPPQHKFVEPELSRMGISMGRLTNPEQFAEKIVPLIVASGTPSHAYTWIEEEVTIWHFS